MYSRYYLLRKRVANCSINNFFITNTSKEINKIFDLVNSMLKEKNVKYADGKLVRISGKLIRKQIETAGAEHMSEQIQVDLAGALCHSATTAKNHYIVETEQVARRQHQAVKLVEQSKLLAEYVLKK